MKTPREILLQRHAAAAPKLDAIRSAAVGKLSNEATKRRSFPTFFETVFLRCSNKFWLELVWPCRRTWAGLTAVWLLLAAFNLTHTDHNQAVAGKSPPPTTEMRLAFQEQQHLLAELVGPPPPAPPAEPPRRQNHQPRSENRRTLMLG